MSDQHNSEDELRAWDIPSFIEPRPPLILHPAQRPRPMKATNLLELFEDLESEETELLQVYLRLKPCKEINELYEVRSDKCFITSMDTTTMGHGGRTQHNISKMYTFSKIFGPESPQNEVFEAVVKANLKKLPEGQSFTLLTYGASGSGKTYTLMGTVGAPGLVPRSLEYVFKLIEASQQPSYKPTEGGGKNLSYAEQEFELQWVKKLRQTSVPLRNNYRRMSTQLNSFMSGSSINLANRRRHYVWVSFVEIYNEAIYDLLAPPEKRTKLRIREDSSGNVYVKGANQAFVRSGEEAYDVLVAGKHNLVVASTGIHAQSSRSHCIFTITMLTETDNGIRSSCVRLCDLAGCERARATGNTGTRMAESRAINTSLHVLERCLHALQRLQKMRQRQNHRNDPIVPYRESKLTRLLGSGLSGSQGESVSMVVTLNPALRYANETKHVLSLAAVAQDIQLSNTVLTSTFGSYGTQEDSSVDVSAEVMKLRADNERLHYELALAHSRNDDLAISFEEHRQKMSKTMYELVEETKDIARCHYEAQIKFLKDEMNDMVEEYERRLTEAVAPVASNDMPQRCLQSKITELMSKIEDLEEKLTTERLARSRAENEVEYLRNCIAEKDEIAYRLGHQDDVVTLSDSEHGSDYETDDPLSESLEPVFKMVNLNKTQQKAKIEHVPSCKTIDEDLGNSTKTHKHDLPEVIAIDYTSDDDNHQSASGNIIQNIKTEIKTQQKAKIEHVPCCKTFDEDLGNSTKTHENDLPEVIAIDYTSDGDNHQNSSGNIKQNIKTEIKDSLPYMELNELKFIKKEEEFSDIENSVSQAKRCLENEISKSSEVDEEKLKKLNLQRGSYGLATNTALPEDSFDLNVNENLENSADFNLDKDKMNDCKATLQLSKEYFDEKANENLENRAGNYSMDNDEKNMNNIKPTTSEYKTETVNKLIQSFKTKQCRDNSLSQFEELEMATKSTQNYSSEEKVKNVAEIKTLKDRRNYFGDSLHFSSNMVNHNIKLFNEICKPLENKVTNKDPNELLKIKRIYFDNIDVSAQTAKNKITETTCMPRACKDVNNDSESMINLKPFVESVTRSTENFYSINKNVNVNINDSLNLFDEPESPITVKPVNTMSNIEMAQKSIEKLVLNHNANKILKSEVKLDTVTSVQNSNNTIKQPVVAEYEIKPTNLIVPQLDKEIFSNTIEEFDNIYKATTSRVTEFDLLFSNETATKINTEKDNYIDPVIIPVQKDSQCEDGVRYGLRNRVITNTLKKSLRLRKQKDQNEDEMSNIGGTKFKDIGNLQQEFSDITIDVPVIRKEVKDISSPEKVTEEEENVPPEQGIRSCPAKSVTRSRRKLFTPQVEPLDESLGHTGDSNERIRVPRPSYHRGRARRKL